MSIKIYKVGNTTYVKEVLNGSEHLFASNKNRDLKIYADGVIIMPDKDSQVLNNFKIPLASLVDNFGATTPQELIEALGQNEYFKKGGGGVGGSTKISEDFTVVLPSGANIGYESGDVITKDTELELVVKKILRVGNELSFTLPTGNITTSKPGSLLYEIGQNLKIDINHSFNQNDAGSFESVQYRKNGVGVNGVNYGFEISPIAQIFDALINYAAGSGTKVNEIGEIFENDIDAGSIDTANLSFGGQLPFFYGKSATKPTANQSLIDAGTKAVNGSLIKSANGTLAINFNAVGEFIWFAIPNTAPNKTTYYKTALDTGSIDLIFEDEEVVSTINSPNGLWLNEAYTFYIAKGVGTHNTNIELRN